LQTKTSLDRKSRAARSTRNGSELRVAAVRAPTVLELHIQKERAQREKYGKFFETYFDNLRQQLDIDKALESSDEERDVETLSVLKQVKPDNDP